MVENGFFVASSLRLTIATARVVVALLSANKKGEPHRYGVTRYVVMRECVLYRKGSAAAMKRCCSASSISPLCT